MSLILFKVVKGEWVHFATMFVTSGYTLTTAKRSAAGETPDGWTLVRVYKAGFDEFHAVYERV